MLKSKFIILLFFYAFSQSVFSFYTKDSSRKKALAVFQNASLINIDYGLSAPFLDLAKRYGRINGIGIGYGYKFNRNFFINASGSLLFSNKVRENGILDSIIGPSNELIDAQGNFAVLRLYQRGYMWHVNFGKIFPINKSEMNSGLMVTGGIGFIQHKIKFQFSRTIMPQLENNYYKGYDRLSNGIMFRQFTGYQRIDPNGMLNFYAGIESILAFTKSQREINFDTRTKDLSTKKDLLIGMKFGIIIPIKGRVAGGKKGENNTFFE